MRALLDTSVLVGGVADFGDAELAVSAISLAELHFGVLVAPDAGARAVRLQRLASVERRFDPLPVDAMVAAAYGQLASAVVAHGRQPRRRAFDLMIAATALAHDATLLTYNLDDFAGLESLLQVRAPQQQ
ncbi:type II toxin-antitoxin system VapC family toxin [Cellulomonas sp. Leaf334]|uniref:type II toxin-antitoxin system VapC family toxin n=1 Tax=Cellulomonas sp. Leaf334 TaxID=1736339 RepID=UPI0006FF6BAB|nr:type II toxin-antitoxin system VapC family toxin [Cellulomonas sp. Leaf334]KQR10333.1 twitching motility protein PilT [Cellulomonas sp. Leaf334]